MPKARMSRRGKSGSHVRAARSAPGADIPASISAGLLTGVGVGIRRVRGEEVDFTPRELQRGSGVVVVKSDVHAHVAVGALPRDDVDAQLRAAAFQVPAIGVAGAESGLDDA